MWSKIERKQTRWMQTWWIAAAASRCFSGWFQADFTRTYLFNSSPFRYFSFFPTSLLTWRISWTYLLYLLDRNTKNSVFRLLLAVNSGKAPVWEAGAWTPQASHLVRASPSWWTSGQVCTLLGCFSFLILTVKWIKSGLQKDTDAPFSQQLRDLGWVPTSWAPSV